MTTVLKYLVFLAIASVTIAPAFASQSDDDMPQNATDETAAASSSVDQDISWRTARAVPDMQLAQNSSNGVYLHPPQTEEAPLPAAAQTNGQNIASRGAQSVPSMDDEGAANATTMTATRTATRPMSSDKDAYGIEPGDVLQVSVWKEDALDREVVVLPDGHINFPLIGSVNVLNKSPEDVQADIKSRLHKFIPDASVSVVVKADLGHTVSVIGQVQKPGELIMSHHLSVMMALSQAGGLTPYAKQSRILILRRDAAGKETAIRFPYGDVVDGDDLDKDIFLEPGDVVVVPTAGLF